MSALIGTKNLDIQADPFTDRNSWGWYKLGYQSSPPETRYSRKDCASRNAWYVFLDNSTVISNLDEIYIAEEGGGGKVILLERGGYQEMDACLM